MVAKEKDKKMGFLKNMLVRSKYFSAYDLNLCW